MKNYLFIVSICCLVIAGNAIDWQKGDGTLWAMDCDFNDGDMGREWSTGPECGGKCRATSGCTHFAFLNGWCYKKWGSVSLNDAFWKSGVVCGILYF